MSATTGSRTETGPRLALDWSLGRSDAPDRAPDGEFPARVPGAVQLDWARAQDWPDHAWDCEAERYRGLEDFHWHYRARCPALPADGTRQLVVEDIDHHGVIRVDGRTVAEGGGIGRTLRASLDGVGEGALIEVVVFPAPKEDGLLGRARARRTTKAAVSYGWDFHPDLVPLGIAGGAWIECLDPVHIRDLRWRDALSEDFSRAEFRVGVTLSAPGSVSAAVLDPDGRVLWEGGSDGVRDAVEMHGVITDPGLWWPRGQGAQTLHRLVVTCADGGRPGQRIERSVGFRRVRLIMAPDQWDEPSEFPKSRSLPPMNLEVNGRRIFAKGANVVGPDIFPGTVDDARWSRLATRAAEANMNTLRVWGGAAPPRDAFFEACDELGILIVQEFPLACNDYPDDPGYLAELESAARALIDRLAFHPCRALWSGGNELFNAWSGMTDQSHALRLLAARAWLDDPDTPFVPTLPVEGLGHGYYLFRDPQSGVECFELFQNARNTGYTEFGVPGAAPVEQIRRIVPEDSLWPPRPEGVWKLHSGMEAWDVEPTSYLCLSTISHYWGDQPDLPSLVAKSQWLQCEGHKAIIEEGRRQRPFCGWTLMWCLNEPWPTVANQCLLAHPDRPKPALDAVADAMRPTLASARVPKFQWTSGEWFTADLWILHDAPGARPAISVRAELHSGDWSHTALGWAAPEGASDTDLPGPTLRVRLPETFGSDLRLDLVTDPPEYSSHYRLATRRTAAVDADGPAPRGLNV